MKRTIDHKFKTDREQIYITVPFITLITPTIIKSIQNNKLNKNAKVTSSRMLIICFLGHLLAYALSQIVFSSPLSIFIISGYRCSSQK